MLVSTRPSDDLHQLYGSVEESVQAAGGFDDHETRSEILLLRRDPYRTVVGVAGSHPEATDCLDCRIGDSNGVGSQGKGFDEIRLRSEPAGNDQGDVKAIALVQMLSRPRKCGIQSPRRKLAGSARARSFAVVAMVAYSVPCTSRSAIPA